jgi:hypothetical protein
MKPSRRYSGAHYRISTSKSHSRPGSLRWKYIRTELSSCEDRIFDIDRLTGVRHIIINKVYGKPRVLGEWSNEEQYVLEQWVRGVAEAGRPLESITFDDPLHHWPVTAVVTEKPAAAGGPSLQIVESGINLR